MQMGCKWMDVADNEKISGIPKYLGKEPIFFLIEVQLMYNIM